MPLETVKSQKKDLYRKTKCRYCNSSLPEPFLDLGTMPLANSFLKPEKAHSQEFSCPLRLAWCPTCKLTQLCDVVPADFMFANYLYVSSTTETFKRHFADYAKTVRSLFPANGQYLAVDVGSNDGLLLSSYEKEGMKAVGIEPAKNLAGEANQANLRTINDYLNSSSVQAIQKEFGQAHVISANNVFAHIDDIHEALKCVVELLDPSGVFVIEFPYLPVMVEQMLFDMIYHEHLSYIALTALQWVLKQYDLEIFQVQQVASHGGSARVFIQKEGANRPISQEVTELLKQEIQKGYDSFEIYQQFAQRVYRVREELIRFIKDIKSKGKSIVGYGAPAKGNTLINFCGLTPAQIDYVVEDNPLKQNLLTPGAKIPVRSNTQLFEAPPDFVLIFAWNFATEIIKKLESLKQKGVRFIVPLPQPKIV